MADGIRRAMLLAESAALDLDVGILVLAPDDSVEMANRAAAIGVGADGGIARARARTRGALGARAGLARW